jgi:hypothetical protein
MAKIAVCGEGSPDRLASGHGRALADPADQAVEIIDLVAAILLLA